MQIVERLAQDLKDAGFNIWFDQKNIGGGQNWRDAIFKGIQVSDYMVVCLSPQAVRSEWVRREILMMRSQDKLIIPVVLEREEVSNDIAVDVFTIMPEYDETAHLLDIQILDFVRFGYETTFPRLLRSFPDPLVADGATEEETHHDSATIPNPFKGLEAFQQTDADVFFGRESTIDRMLHTLQDEREARFLAVVGGSGVGKSSVVRAGLIPAIRANRIPGSEHWRIVIVSPGPRPVEALAARLLPQISGGRLLPEIVDVLNSKPDALHQLIEGILPAADALRFVIVVDQFEEVFTRVNQVDARHFLDLLVAAVTLSGGRTSVVVTMRADFFDRLSSFPTMARLFEQHNLVIVTDMEKDGLRSSIVEPARVVGLQYENGLPDRILDDVYQQPGSLPLLQYALKELYNKRTGRIITVAAYEQIGGVQGALGQHAESIFTGLTLEQQNFLRRLLLRLVEVSSTGKATRRRVDREQLTFSGVSNETVEEIVGLLSAPENRLIRVDREIESKSDGTQRITIELSHEALTREWLRLRDWIIKDEADLHLGGEILRMASHWEQAGRSVDYLLTGARLVEAESWLQRTDSSDLQRQFIEASAIQRTLQTAVDQARQRRELRRVQAFLVILAALLVLAVIFGLLATEGQNQAVANAQTALIAQGISEMRATEVSSALEKVDIQRLDALAQAAWERQNLPTGYLRAYEAVQRDHSQRGTDSSLNDRSAPIPESYSILLQGRQTFLPVFATLALPAAPSHSFAGSAWSHNEVYVATWSDSGDLTLWDLRGETIFQALAMTTALSGALWNDDDTRLLIWSEQGMIAIWDTVNSQLTYAETIEASSDGGIPGIAGLDWSAQTHRFVGWLTDSRLCAWDEQGGTLQWCTTPQESHTDRVIGALYNRDSDLIVSWSLDDSARVWESDSGELKYRLRHDENVFGAAWSADQSHLMSWADDDTVALWSMKNGQQIASLPHDGDVNGAVWNEAGDRILSWTQNGTLFLWQRVDGGENQSWTLLRTYRSDAERIFYAAWDQHEKHILAAAEAGLGAFAVYIWNTEDDTAPLHRLNQTGTLLNAAWNNNGNAVLTATSDGTASIWDVETGQNYRVMLHGTGLMSASWSADGTYVLTTSDRYVRLWDVDGVPIMKLMPDTSAGWNDDGTTLLHWTQDGVGMKETYNAAGEVVHTPIGVEFPVYDAEIQGENVLMWDETAAALLLMSNHCSQAAAMPLGTDQYAHHAIDTKWNKAGDKFAIWAEDTWLLQIVGECGDAVEHIDESVLDVEPLSVVQGARWNEDGSALLVWVSSMMNMPNADKALVIDADTYQQSGTPLEHATPINGAAWSDDGTQIITWSANTLSLWGAQSRALRLEPIEHSGNVIGAVWNRAGTQIMSWSANAVQLWDAQSGTLLPEPIEHPGDVMGAVWNENETLILSWTSDNILYIWDVSDMEIRVQWPHSDPIVQAGWLAGEDYIVSLTDDGNSRHTYIWPTSWTAFVTDIEKSMRHFPKRLMD